MTEKHAGRHAAPVPDAASPDSAAVAGENAPAPEGGAPAEEAATAPAAAAERAAGQPAPAAPPGATEAVALKDRGLRAEAELQNFRRRAQRDLEQGRRDAEESVMLELLRVLDDLDRAVGVAREAGAPEPWAEGVGLVGARLADYLARQGVTPIEALGQPFDPAFHEAVLQMPSPEVAPGHVLEVVSKGWRRGDRPLRAARVVVAAPPAESEG